MTSRIIVAVLLIAIASESGRAEEPKQPSAPVEHRSHHVIAARDGSRIYEWTAILRLSDDADENALLVRDAGYGDFVIRRTWNFKTQIVEHRISDVRERVFLKFS